MRGLNWLTGRGRQESRSGEEGLREATPQRTATVDGWHPAQTGRALLQSDETRRLIRVLTENSPFSQQVTEAWWLRPLEDMAARVSPACFYRYASASKDTGADKDRLQKSFESLNVHHSRSGKGLFHYHHYDTPDKSGRFTRVSGYMINADIIFKKGSCPADSIWLSARR